jgi:hypothetical protein
MLKPIIESITPDNIKNIKLVDDALDIFVDYLVEHSDIAIDIKNMFDKKHTIINTEMLKIYLNNVYNLFDEVKKSNAIYEAFQNDPLLINSNAEVDIIQDIDAIMDVEQYLTSKNYKEAKGTKLGFQYIYDLVMNSGILGDVYKDSESYFKYSETDNIFEYRINGAISPELYHILVEPITHPLGWNYIYTRLVSSIFNDYFKLDYTYNFDNGYLHVKCQKQGPDIVHDYITGNIYYENNPNNIIGSITEVRDFSVDFVETLKLEKGFKTSVYFNSGEVLVSKTIPISTKLYANVNDADSNSNAIIDYDAVDENGQLPHCALHISYDVEINTLIEDEIIFWSQSVFKDYFDHRYTTPAIIGECLVENYSSLSSDGIDEIVTDDGAIITVSGQNSSYGVNADYICTDNEDIIISDDEDILINEVSGNLCSKPLVGWFIIGGDNIEKRLTDEAVYEPHLILDARELDKTSFGHIENGVGTVQQNNFIGDTTLGMGTITQEIEEFDISTHVY